MPMPELNQPPVNSDAEPAFSFDVGRYIRALRRYAWLLVALVALAVTGSVYYTRQQPEIFEATASVQIEPRMADLLGQGNEMVAVGGGPSGEYYKEQRQVLGSIRLLRETVIAKNLQLTFLSEDERTRLPLDQQYDTTAVRLKKRVTIQYPEQNRIMYVVVSHSDPKLAPSPS